jgi:hypothetical protein
MTETTTPPLGPAPSPPEPPVLPEAPPGSGVPTDGTPPAEAPARKPVVPGAAAVAS